MPRLARDVPLYGMLSDEGDIAVQRVVQMMVAEVRMGQVTRETLPDRIRLGLKYVAWQATDGKGHQEVYEPPVQEAIEDEINRQICLPMGWARINRWDW